MRIRITAFRFFFCTGTCLLYFDGGGAGAGATAVKMGRPGARAATRGYMVPDPPKGGGGRLRNPESYATLTHGGQAGGHPRIARAHQVESLGQPVIGQARQLSCGGVNHFLQFCGVRTAGGATNTNTF